MKSNGESKHFENNEEAEILLKESRKRIDEIDNALFDLISQRTALAKDIVFSKDYLGLPIYDKDREEAIHKKIEKLSKENNLDSEIIDQIFSMLTKLSKNMQKQILKEEC
ncbi:chorismate mutase [Methanobrevibacter sp.]|uniref:chorismate mutase n=1 Tax=Methanobrevibacter sp. TaxID=66852 RepID=UPI0025F09E03|nr:chorismate mutase [Methanobrevibacter sp.]